nr:hypothetical protein [Bradyrhizobium centrolobii]
MRWRAPQPAPPWQGVREANLATVACNLRSAPLQ